MVEVCLSERFASKGLFHDFILLLLFNLYDFNLIKTLEMFANIIKLNPMQNITKYFNTNFTPKVLTIIKE